MLFMTESQFVNFKKLQETLSDVLGSNKDKFITSKFKIDYTSDMYFLTLKSVDNSDIITVLGEIKFDNIQIHIDFYTDCFLNKDLQFQHSWYKNNLIVY